MATHGRQIERLLKNYKTRDKNHNDETPSLFSQTSYEVKDNESHMSYFFPRRTGYILIGSGLSYLERPIRSKQRRQKQRQNKLYNILDEIKEITAEAVNKIILKIV